MKVVNTKQLKDGRVRMTVTLERGEALAAHPVGQTALSLDEHAHYKLGYPMDDEVIHGAILAQASKTRWCSLSQEWVE